MRNPSPTLIGAFVLGALALVAAAIIFFGGGALLGDRIRAVSYFDKSVTGLQVGAAVTFRGVRVGDVTSMGVRLNPETLGGVIQVNMEIRPETVATFGNAIDAETNVVTALVQRGLTAKLVQQSFVTGQLMVELDFRPDTPAQALNVNTPVPEIPTVPSDLEAIAQRIADVRLDETLQSVQDALKRLNVLLTKPEIAQAVEALPQLVVQARETLATMQTQAEALSTTASTSLAEVSAELQQTLDAVQGLSVTLDHEVAQTAAATRTTLQTADTALEGAAVLLDPRGRTAVQMQRAAEDLAVSAARLRNLAERLDRDPSILIRGN